MTDDGDAPRRSVHVTFPERFLERDLLPAYPAATRLSQAVRMAAFDGVREQYADRTVRLEVTLSAAADADDPTGGRDADTDDGEAASAAVDVDLDAFPDDTGPCPFCGEEYSTRWFPHITRECPATTRAPPTDD